MIVPNALCHVRTLCVPLQTCRAAAPCERFAPFAGSANTCARRPAFNVELVVDGVPHPRWPACWAQPCPPDSLLKRRYPEVYAGNSCHASHLGHGRRHGKQWQADGLLVISTKRPFSPRNSLRAGQLQVTPGCCFKGIVVSDARASRPRGIWLERVGPGPS